MVYKATHNSATGESCKGLLSYLVTPFARTQSKNLKEQFDCGCRYFDLRIRFNKDDDIINSILCHGAWVSNRTLEYALDLLQRLSNEQGCETFVMITYEGKCPIVEQGLKIAIKEIMSFSNYPNLTLTEINIKKPIWKNIYKHPFAPYYTQGYKVLDGSSWHTYIPIPWLWNKICKPTSKCCVGYIFEDFI